MTQKQENRMKRKRSWSKADNTSGYIFIAVAMIIFATFTVYPVFSAIETSFVDYKPFGSEYVGLENYFNTFKSSLFYKSVKNTIVYTIIVVPLSLMISFSIAVMVLAFKKRTQSVFKAIYYLPGIASGVALSVVWL